MSVPATSDVPDTATAETAALFARTRRELLFRRLRWALLALLVAIVLLTFRDYGSTWDESLQKTYGDLVIRYYTSGLHDLGANSYMNAYYYGGLFDGCASLLSRLLPLDEYDTRHLLNALVGVAAMAACGKVGRLLGGDEAGFWSALLLALAAPFYGHMFNNPKDIPFATGYIWSLYCLLASVLRFPRVPVSLAVKTGVAIGLTCGVRFGGAVFFAYWLLAVAVHLATCVVRGEGARAVASRSFRLALSTLLVVGVAYPVMLVFWPWAQQRPLRGPLEAARELSHLPMGRPSLFQGVQVIPADLPASYLPTYLLAKLPEPTIVLVSVAFVLAASSRLRRLRANADARGAHVLLGFSVLFPIGYALATRTVLYDEMRQFLFIVPPLSCIAGISLARVVARVQLWRAMPRMACIALLLIWVAWQVTVMVRLHPYQFAYYNLFTGGLPGAAGRYELDYWGSTYREAVKTLELRLRQELGNDFDTRRFRVSACGPAQTAEHYFPASFIREDNTPSADFSITFTREPCYHKPGAPVMFTVERMGVTLATVWDLRPTRQE